MDLIQLSSMILNTLLYATQYVMSKYIYRIQKQKLSTNDKQLAKAFRYQRRKIKIIIMGFPTLLCFAQNYYNLCLSYTQSEKLNIFECLKKFDTEKIGMGILTSFYMTLLLYIGPVYQEFWNGNLREKFSKIRFNKFRWDYFTKIVIVLQIWLQKLKDSNFLIYISYDIFQQIIKQIIKHVYQFFIFQKTPLIDEIIFRELVNNAINVRYQNNIQFIIYSTLLYSLTKALSYHLKYGQLSRYEFLKTFVLGLYLSFVLVQTKTIVTVIINHGLMNFMGRPNFKDLVKGNYSNEQRQKMIRFYVLGFVAFLIFCVLVL